VIEQGVAAVTQLMMINQALKLHKAIADASITNSADHVLCSLESHPQLKHWIQQQSFQQAQ
jgi:hypothetical protein